MALYPTKTRLRLLAAARTGHIVHDAGTYWLEIDGDPVRATARVAEAIAAGWLEHGPRLGIAADPLRVVLTDTGRAVLDAGWAAA